MDVMENFLALDVMTCTWHLVLDSFPGSSAGKESACNTETPVRFLSQKFPWRRDRVPSPRFLGFPGGSDG